MALVLIGLSKVLKQTDFELPKRKRILGGTFASIFGWVFLVSILSISGFLGDFSTFPPRMFIVLLTPLAVILVITFSAGFEPLLRLVTPQWFLNVQSFSIIVEILLWMLFIQNLAPVQMTFEGRNWDILSGLLGPVMGVVAFSGGRTRRKVLLFYNVLGLVLLINILVVAVLSMPTPARMFMNDPANTIVAQFPFVLLPGILVPMAYSMHFFSLRQMQLLKANK